MFKNLMPGLSRKNTNKKIIHDEIRSRIINSKNCQHPVYFSNPGDYDITLKTIIVPLRSTFYERITSLTLR